MKMLLFSTQSLGRSQALRDFDDELGGAGVSVPVAGADPKQVLTNRKLGRYDPVFFLA
jgi:hypothetical protein